GELGWLDRPRIERAGKMRVLDAVAQEDGPRIPGAPRLEQGERAGDDEIGPRAELPLVGGDRRRSSAERGEVVDAVVNDTRFAELACDPHGRGNERVGDGAAEAEWGERAADRGAHEDRVYPIA